MAATPPRDRRERCAVTRKLRPRKELMLLDALRPELADFIRREHPKLAEDALISKSAVNAYRSRYVEELLREEHGEFTELDRQVTESIANQDTIAENVEQEFESERTFGERAADILAKFGGSWSFLISFAVFLSVWMTINIVAGGRAFDAYPFILLNLVLSTIAAIQAPVIMMSQRRQEEKDRLRVDQRVPRQPQGRARDPPPPRKARPSDHPPVAAPRRDPAHPAGDDAGAAAQVRRCTDAAHHREP